MFPLVRSAICAALLVPFAAAVTQGHGGASAFILRHALEAQGAQDALDVPARTLTAVASRSPVGQDGDHYTKPSREDVIASVYAIARERDPERFPEIW